MRILLLAFFLCLTNISFAQKLWGYAKANCMPPNLSECTLLFPITSDDEKKLEYDYEIAKKLFTKYYPYKYAFVTEDSLNNMDSLANYYALRKKIVTRKTSTQTGYYSNSGYSSSPSFHSTGSYNSSYETYEYRFTKGDVDYSYYKTIEIYSTRRYKSLKYILRNLYYDVQSNKPKDCFKVNLVAPIPRYSRIGVAYEHLILRKTWLGMYAEAGSWKYAPPFNIEFSGSDFFLLQLQLVRYFSLFNNNPCEGWLLGIAPFFFYNKDYFNHSNPDITENSQTVNGYGVKGMIGYQLMIGKTIVISAWGGPQYRFNTNNNYLYENIFLSSNYSTIGFTGQVCVGFVLK